MAATAIIEPYGALCALRVFTINDITADKDDFVEQYDHALEDAEDYACGNMTCDPLPATEEVLNKYGISLAEFNDIQEKVSEALSFGCCGWCV